MLKAEILNVLYGKDKLEVYRKFQEIENSIDNSNELYECFDEIKDMLLNDKSSIRVRGFKIICKLSKWDNENKVNNCINIVLNELDDDKPTAVRQCLHSLSNLLQYKPELSNIIKDKLKKINLCKYKDSMSHLIEKDIEELLKII